MGKKALFSIVYAVENGDVKTTRIDASLYTRRSGTCRCAAAAKKMLQTTKISCREETSETKKKKRKR